MTENLLSSKCVPCSIGTPVLEGEELKVYIKEIDDSWQLINNEKIEREYNFKNFKEALAFVNKIGEVAEEQGHHPDFELGWGRVKVSLMTHKINGLSKNDFIMAALIDEL